jgi:IS30 family transposase
LGPSTCRNTPLVEVGVLMTRRGRKRRLEIETRYWELILSGVGTVEACQAVGIGRKTGYRWRAENGGLPPALVAEGTRSSRPPPQAHPADPRCAAAGSGAGQARTGVEPRTDRQPPAHRVPGPAELAFLPRDDLPGHLPRREGRPEPHTHQEAADRPADARTTSSSGRATQPVRHARPADRPPTTDHRPPVVCTRTRVGDWEGDLIVGRGNRSAIATLVDRTSRYLKLVYLADDHSAGTVRDALIASFGGLLADVRLTLTWDQGSELAHHGEIPALFREGVFFAPPRQALAARHQRGHEWSGSSVFAQAQRPLSPHASRPGRHRVPAQHRPRKRLDWRTPLDVFQTALAS